MKFLTLFSPQKRLLTLALVLLSMCQIWAQQQPVSVMPTLAPPYSPYLRDYLEKAVITLTNHSSERLGIKLVGSLQNDDGFYVRTAQDYQPLAPIVLEAHQTRTIYARREAQRFFDPDNVETNLSQRQQNVIRRMGMIPEGNYSFCIRALDFVTGAPLSADEPAGCLPITVAYPEPPILVGPECESDVFSAYPSFSWLPPAGPAAHGVEYDFYLLKLLPGQDPNDAMQLAVNYGGGNPFKAKGLKIPLYAYKASDPPLIDGERYAWQVVVRDPLRRTVFQNGGRSEVCTFTKKKSGKLQDPPSAIAGGPVNVQQGTCESQCLFSLSGAGSPVGNPQAYVAVDSFLQIGTFDMRILSLTASPAGTLSGTGVIALPFVNVEQIRLRVTFSQLKINASRRVLEGEAFAKVHAGAASLMPGYNQPNWDGVGLGGANLLNIQNYISSQVDSIKQGLMNTYHSIGFEVPLGYSNGGHSLAITKVRFTPTFAQFSAVGVIDLPSFTGTVTPLAVGAANICFSKDDLCQEGKLFLASDFGVDLASDPGYELKLLKGNADPDDDAGTFLTFDTSGIKIFHLEADYDLPADKIVRADNQPGPVKLHFEATMDSIADWMFTAVAPDFQLKDNKDFTFLPDTVYIDLTEARNPPAFNDPNLYNGEYADPTWTGVYCKQLAVKALNPLNQSPNPTQLGIQNLFIDSTGLSVNVFGKNLINLTEGQVESFNFSVDTLFAEIRHNSFTHAGFAGGMLFNIAGREYDAGGYIKVGAGSEAKKNLVVFSCLIQSVPNQNGQGTHLDYEFSMQPKDDLNVPLWYFTLQIDQSSHVLVKSKQNGDFYAEAVLNGVFGVQMDNMITGSGIAGITFQGMGLKSESPYFMMGNFGTTLGGNNAQGGGKGDNQQSAVPGQQNAAGDGDDGGMLGDFPIQLNSVDFVQDAQGHPGMSFDLSLNLSDMASVLPNATTQFSIYGRLDFVNGEIHPEFDHFELNKICIEGNISAVHLAGCIYFFNNHNVYGNGFLGNLKVSFPPGMEVSATVQFGNKSGMNYWYTDAMLILPEGSGIPIFSGIELFGLGGGAYYHMKRTPGILNYKYSQSSNYDPDPNAVPLPGSSPGGYAYVPDAGILFGIKAKIYVGTQGDRDACNADVQLEINFTPSGGLGQINLDGAVRFVSDDQMEKGAIKGELHAQYDNTTKIFQTNAGIELDFDIVTAKGGFDMYSDGKNGNWHMRFGRPIPNEWVNITIAGFLTFETYFEAGNFEIDPMPAPPAFISKLVNGSLAQSASERSKLGADAAFTIIHGGRFGFDEEGSFLCFFAKLQAGAGYDLALRKVTAGCDGNPENAHLVGIDGWYATGQAYAGIVGQVGIEADFGIAKGKFIIAEMGIGTIIQAGFLNPTWVDGAVGGYYSLFDGAIHGKFDYEFSLGQKCEIDDPDPLETMKLVTDIYPADGSKNVDVMSVPGAATVLQMDRYKEIHLEQQLAGGSTKHYLFRFDKEQVTAELHKKNGDNVPLEAAVESTDHYGLAWKPVSTLDRQTDFELHIVAQVEECQGLVTYDSTNKVGSCTTGNWANAKRDGKEFKEEHLIKFKTNNGLDSIPEELVEYTIPYKQERSFVWQNETQPSLKMAQGFNPNSYNIGPPGVALEYQARFIPMDNKNAVQTSPVNLGTGDTLLLTNWPGQLMPGTYYSLQFTASWKDAPKGAPANAINTGDLGAFTAAGADVVHTIHDTTNYLIMQQRNLLENKLMLPKNTAKLYEVRFKTSRYPNITAKLQAMDEASACYRVGSSNHGASTDVVVKKNDLDSPEKTVAAINKQLGNLPSEEPSISYLPYVWMDGPERFDNFDVKGYEKKMPSGEIIKRDPYLEYKSNSALAIFHQQLIHKLKTKIINKGLATEHAFAKIATFSYDIEAPYAGPIGWNDGFHMPGDGPADGGMNAGIGYGGYGISGSGIFGIQGLGSGNRMLQTGPTTAIKKPFGPTMNNDNAASAYDGTRYMSNPLVIKYITNWHNHIDVPDQVDPFEFIGDIVEDWTWGVRPSEEDYIDWVQSLGFGYDAARDHWGTLGKAGIGQPVLGLHGGATFEVKPVLRKSK